MGKEFPRTRGCCHLVYSNKFQGEISSTVYCGCVDGEEEKHLTKVVAQLLNAILTTLAMSIKFPMMVHSKMKKEIV